MRAGQHAFIFSFGRQRENRSLGMVANGSSIGKLFMMNLMGRV
jgi:hypothetical protein